ncbi:hypothetical protein HPB50_003744 [Hyalomma asiaticum]|uniref:Uncharacterized protein n=1 Tax=Hyalomma asiaticum TaxID=266040 RepID=A0ACB7SUL4_HYAAI|nr:hypothetical protein HPB50_003744 [Hyalomma asiaticum]
MTRGASSFGTRFAHREQRGCGGGGLKQRERGVEEGKGCVSVLRLVCSRPQRRQIEGNTRTLGNLRKGAGEMQQIVGGGWGSLRQRANGERRQIFTVPVIPCLSRINAAAEANQLGDSLTLCPLASGRNTCCTHDTELRLREAAWDHFRFRLRDATAPLRRFLDDSLALFRGAASFALNRSQRGAKLCNSRDHGRRRIVVFARWLGFQQPPVLLGSSTVVLGRPRHCGAGPRNAALASGQHPVLWTGAAVAAFFSGAGEEPNFSRGLGPSSSLRGSMAAATAADVPVFGTLFLSSPLTTRT